MEEPEQPQQEQPSVASLADAGIQLAARLREANENGQPLVREDASPFVYPSDQARDEHERRLHRLRRLAMKDGAIVASKHHEKPCAVHNASVIRPVKRPDACARRLFGGLLRRRRGTVRRPGCTSSRRSSRGSPSGDPDEPVPPGSRAAWGESQTTARHRLVAPDWFARVYGNLSPGDQLNGYIALSDEDAQRFANHILAATEADRATT